jgi:hypothetical protein
MRLRAFLVTLALASPAWADAYCSTSGSAEAGTFTYCSDGTSVETKDGGSYIEQPWRSVGTAQDPSDPSCVYPSYCNNPDN